MAEPPPRRRSFAAYGIKALRAGQGREPLIGPDLHKRPLRRRTAGAICNLAAVPAANGREGTGGVKTTGAVLPVGAALSHSRRPPSRRDTHKKAVRKRDSSANASRSSACASTLIPTVFLVNYWISSQSPGSRGRPPSYPAITLKSDHTTGSKVRNKLIGGHASPSTRGGGALLRADNQPPATAGDWARDDYEATPICVR